MSHLERFLVRLDSWPWSGIYRVGLGLCIPRAFRAVSGGHGQVWISLALFVGLLVGLRLIPAVLRHALPFSVEAKKIWTDRRNIAKLHDCYQWQKLFWIGLGLLLYAVVGDGLRTDEIIVTSICLTGGGLGLLFWCRINASALGNALSG